MKLTARKVATIREPGMYGDGRGLYLRVAPSGGKYWILRVTIHRKRCHLGLGSADLLSLADAREKAAKFHRIIADGRDPRKENRRVAKTVREIAADVLDHRSKGWSSAKHAEKWWSSLERHVFPRLGDRNIATITQADILDVLSLIWATHSDTSRRLAQRLSRIMDWARSVGAYAGDNPVSAARIALGSARVEVQHRKALPWQDAPAFYAELRKREAVSARALRFLILTAARTGEVRGARWEEIDGDVWTVPAERMKMVKEHRVPLSAEALGVLEEMRGLGRDLIFPSHHVSREEPLSANGMIALLKRMDRPDLHVHGFRTTFRTWAADSARAPREVAERSLAHLVGSDVERAYQRSDLLDQRRALMDAWARFVTGEAGDVVQLVRG